MAEESGDLICGDTARRQLRKVILLEEFHSIRFDTVVWLTAYYFTVEMDVEQFGWMAVFLWVVEVKQLDHSGLIAGFFGYLTDDSLGRGFVDVNEAAWQCPFSFVQPLLDHQDLVIPKDCASDTDLWRGVSALLFVIGPERFRG